MWVLGASPAMAMADGFALFTFLMAEGGDDGETRRR